VDAQQGSLGVDFHGGKNVYSPIEIDQITNDVVAVQPRYYGMLLFDEAAAGTLIGVDVSTDASA